MMNNILFNSTKPSICFIMNKNIILVLLTALVAAAIGQFTGHEIRNNLRLRRRSSRRKTELMINAANVNNGKFGIYASLVVP